MLKEKLTLSLNKYIHRSELMLEQQSMQVHCSWICYEYVYFRREPHCLGGFGDNYHVLKEHVQLLRIVTIPRVYLFVA